jgi:AraC-like DNA-binding protein
MQKTGDAMRTLVRAAVLTNYFEVAEQLGLNPQQLLSSVGLRRKLLADPESRIPLASAISLLEESARVSGCESFGLRMAELRQPADIGVVSVLLTHQRTLRDALQVLMQYQHLMNESLAIYIEDAGSTVILRQEIVGDFPTAARQGAELAIGVLFRLCEALLAQHWHPINVTFTHAAPKDVQLHRRLFRCRLQFGGEFNGISCASADLDYPNPLGDPAMARNAARLVETLPASASSKPSVIMEVRKAIYVGLPMGRATIDQVAQSLGMNVRTLQRRLDDNARTFSDLTDEVRRELVLRYMENLQYSIGRIAELLGYSVMSSFTRWFKAQFGLAPEKWRAQQRTAAHRPRPKKH